MLKAWVSTLAILYGSISFSAYADFYQVPLLIPCEACNNNKSKKSEICLKCGHPTEDSLSAYKEAQRLKKIQQQEEIKAVKERQALEQKLNEASELRKRHLAKEIEEEFKAYLETPNKFGGFDALELIRESKIEELGTLNLKNKGISDISPIKVLNNLKVLNLSNNNITDLTPIQGLKKLQAVYITNNPLSDLSPLNDLPCLYELAIGNDYEDYSFLKNLLFLRRLYLPGDNISFVLKDTIERSFPHIEIILKVP